MSSKDNWDDSSDDEGDSPPDPLYNAKGDLVGLQPDPPKVEKIVYDEVLFVDHANEEDQVEISEVDEEDGVDGSHLNDACEADACEADAREMDSCEVDYGYPPEEYYSEEDDDYADELDNYDKKLGRYVSCR
jgi:hypothetical protein